MMIIRLLGKIVALPMLLLIGIAWVFVKLMTTVLSIAHGLFWFMLAVFAVIAIVSQMWFQLAQVAGWAVVSLVILSVGVGIEVALESTAGKLVGFVCHA